MGVFALRLTTARVELSSDHDFRKKHVAGFFVFFCFFWSLLSRASSVPSVGLLYAGRTGLHTADGIRSVLERLSMKQAIITYIIGSLHRQYSDIYARDGTRYLFCTLPIKFRIRTFFYGRFREMAMQPEAGSIARCSSPPEPPVS